MQKIDKASLLLKIDDRKLSGWRWAIIKLQDELY
jgi:hypothetical protein